MRDIHFSALQKRIVEKTKGSMSVIAAAGSGKTRVLTGRVRHLLENVPGSYRILSLTFTNKAADEMKDRLSSIPNISDRAFIGTIHSFCLNILREKGNVIGYGEMPHIFEKESDRLEIVTEVFKRNESLIKYYEKKDERNKRRLLYDALDHISKRKRNLKLNGDEKETELEILYEDYNRFLSEQNAIDYDDIILFAYRIFTEKPKVCELYRKIYRYICVDEAQDLNFAQYQFIKILCGDNHRNVLMVGDDKQAIFGFNGSDKKYFSVNFVTDFNAEIVELIENYRSSKEIIRVANKIYPDSINEENAVYEGLFDCYIGVDAKDEAEYVVNKILYYLHNATKKEKAQIEGSISLDKICVVARNKFILKSIESELNNKQIPYYYKKGSDTELFESDEMRVFELGVRIALNPLDKLHLRQIASILKDRNIPLDDFNNTKKYLSEKSAIFKLIVNSWEKIENKCKNLRDALDVIHYGLQAVNKNENEKSFEIIYEEITLAKQYWKKYCSSTNVDSVSIQAFFSNLALGMVNVKNIKENGIALGTVHSVKGLEYDIVFVIGLNEGSFPDYRAVKAGGRQIEEEKNLTYVAFTRSKRFLHISYPRTKLMPWDPTKPYIQYPSRFLKQILDNCVTKEHLQ